MKHSRYSTMLRVLLALIMLAGLTYWYGGTRDTFSYGLHPERHVRSPFTLDDETDRVASEQPEATRAGLPLGAVLTTLNGTPYHGQAQLDVEEAAGKPGQKLVLGYRGPDGVARSATIAYAASQTVYGARPRLAYVLQRFLLFQVLPLVCMLLGYWVVFVKPGEVNAWMLLVLLIFPAVVFTTPSASGSAGIFLVDELYNTLLQLFGPLVLLPFAIYFPERSRIDVRLPWLKWLVLGPAVASALLLLVRQRQQGYVGTSPAWLLGWAHAAGRATDVLDLLCVVLYLLIVADKLRSASSADARRRLRILLAGTGAGLVVLLVAFVLLPHLGYASSRGGHLWLVYAGALFFMAAPFTLAYVVLVQRAMDVSILVRQGTRYALATASVWVVQLVLMTVVAYSLLTALVARQQMPRDKIWQLALFILLLVLLRFGFRNDSRTWLDKKFFRESYDADLVLSELSAEVRRFTESGPLLETVAKCVAETLHVQRIGMLLRAGPKFVVANTTGPFSPEVQELTLSTTSSAIRRLSVSRAPAQLYRENPDAWYMLAPASERQTLDTLGAELLLPLPGRTRLMGVMALGPKRSEAAYSKSDLQLLQVLATQTGMALEVSELAHSLAQEAAQRERVHREMEIAREVQERLFPQAMPTFAGGTIAGACRPAQGVGGDYYDVFPLGDGRLGLAIGDVSGKGISAALLMASLRASLRGVTLDNPGNFAGVMDKVNRLVCEASADNRYATFFFGAFDPTTCVLECVNAGHNAPLILRTHADGQLTVLPLEADGPVVGLLPQAVYSEQKLRLEAGDLLLCYTDGISEAMRAKDEEWGEERMLAAAAKVRTESADAVLQSIFTQVDAFTKGTAQYDDMTLLILKLHAEPCAVA